MPHAHTAKHGAHLAILDKLERLGEEVRHLTDGLSNEQLAIRVEEGKWSLRELVAHLSRLQGVFAQRVTAMIAQDRPQITSYMPETDPGFESFASRPGNVIVKEFLDDRQKFVTWMRTVEPQQWHRAGIHPDFPDYDVHFALDYMSHHEAHHIYQMFQRRVHFGPLPH